MALSSTASILGGGLLRAAACSAVQLLPKATALAARPWAAAGPSGLFRRGYVQPAPELEPETDRGERAHALPDASLLRAAPRRRADPAAAIPEVFGQVRGPCEHAPPAAALCCPLAQQGPGRALPLPAAPPRCACMHANFEGGRSCAAFDETRPLQHPPYTSDPLNRVLQHRRRPRRALRDVCAGLRHALLLLQQPRHM